MINSLSRNLILSLVAAALLLAPATSVRAADDETELAKQMEVMEKGLKKLRKSLKSSGENPASLETIAEVRKAGVAAKALVPAMASSVPEAERAKFVEAYQKDMDVFIAQVDKLGAAVKAGKNDEAQTIFKTFKKMEDDGHEKYTQ